MRNMVRAAALLGLAAVAGGCDTGGSSSDHIVGVVVDGAVQGGRVDTVRLDAFGAFQDFRGSVRTLDDGSYRQAIPGAGFYQVDVVSGSYTDPITGQSVDLGSRGMHLRAVGTGPGTINVSNVTTLAAGLTARELATGVSMTAALATASDAIGDLFSVGLVRFDPLTTTPANLRDGSFTGGITPESLYGAVLEALSQLAFERDQQTSSPGSGAITALELTEAMVRDLRDGALDGVDASVSPPERVTIGTTGVELVRAGTPFMADLGTAVVAAAPPSLAAADLAAIQSAWAAQSGATDAAAPTISSVTSSFGGTPARVHARGGDTITIAGTGFDASAAVWVDGVLATIQNVSSTAIVATVNADSPGLKRVTVATTAGAASVLEAVRLVGDAFSMDAVNLPGAPVIAGDPDLSFTAGNIVDELGEPVLDGDTFTLTLTFTPDTHAGPGAQPALSATSVTTNAGAISFDVDPGEVTGQFRIEVDADPGIAHQEILITVQPGAPATVTLASSRSQIAADGTSQAQLTGTVTDAFGNRVADGTQVTLTASPGTFGTVSSPVTTSVGDYASSFTVGTTVGQEQITATAGGVSSSPVTIDSVPDVPAQLTDFAIGSTSLSTDGTNGPSFTTVSGVIRDAGGNPVGGGFQVDILVLGPIAPQVSPVTTISDGSFAAVVTATGTPGAATVTAQLVSNPAIFDGTTLTVDPGVQHTVTLAANPATGLVAGVTQVTVSGTVTDSLGNAIPGVNVDLVTTVGSFTSSGTGNATVATDANGAYSATIDPPTATSNGTVSATSGGVSASPVALSYEPGDPAQIVGYTLSPATLSADGGVATATGRVLDQFGNAVKVGTNVDITVAGPIAAQQTPVVTAAADGSFSATVNTTGGVGSATVTATVQGFPAVTESATLTVEVGAVDSVTLVASPATGLVAGVTVVQVSGVVTDQHGNPRPNQDVVLQATGGTFSNSSGTITVQTDANGQYTETLDPPTTTQIVTLTATADGVAATPVSLDYQPGVPATVTVSVASGTLTANGVSNTAVTVDVVDANGNTVSDGTTVTVQIAQGQSGENGSLSPTSATTVAGTAVFTYTAGTRTQTITIEAFAGAVSDTVQVVLEAGPLAALTLAASVATNGNSVDNQTNPQYDLSGTAKDAFGNFVADGVEVALSIDAAATGASFTNAVVTTSGGSFTGELGGVQKVGTFTVTASDNDPSDGSAPDATAQVSFEPGAPDSITGFALGASSIVVGTTTSVSGTVLDQFGNTVADGTTVALTITNNNGSFSPANPTTSGGAFTSTLTAGTIAQAETVQASAGAGVTASAPITFLADVPAPGFALETPGRLPRATADGACEISIASVGTVTDADGNPVQDSETFTVTVSPGGAGAPSFKAGSLSLSSGALSLVVVAGTAPGTYTVTVTSDSNASASASIDLVLERAALAHTSETGSGFSAPVVLTGDVDGDGDVDVVELSTDTAATGQIAVSWNDGTGAFTSTGVSDTQSGAASVAGALADLDFDGDLDLVVSQNTGAGGTAQFDVYLYDPASTSGSKYDPVAGSINVGSSQAGNYVDIAVADVDDDGILDVVTAVGSRLEVFAGTPSSPPAFGAPVDTGVTDTVVRFQLGDLDLAGGLDALVLTNSSLEVALNSELTVAANTATVVDGSGIALPHDLALADMDADGDLDGVISMGSGASAQVVVRRNTRFAGASRFTSLNQPALSAPYAITDFDALRVADVDRNGKPDIVVLIDEPVSAEHLLGVFPQLDTGDAAFDALVTHHSAGVTPYDAGAAAFAVADMDRDGRPDAVAAVTALCSPATLANTGGVSVLRGLADAFTPAFTDVTTAVPSGGGTIAGAAVADVMLDGGPDVLVLRTGNEAIVFDLDNSTSFVELPGSGTNDIDPASSDYFAHPIVADLDRDGLPDLVYDDVDPAIGTDGSISTQTGDGLGGFAAPAQVQDSTLPGTFEAKSVLAGDFVPGGGIDLLGYSWVRLHYEVAVNDGAGNFAVDGTGANLGPGGLEEPFRGVVGQFDDDGYLDVAYIRSAGANDRPDLVFLFGDPTAASLFKPEPATPQIQTTLLDFRDIAVGDFDRDGVDDVVAVAPNQASIVTPKPASGSFPASFVTGIGNDPQSVAVADFDRDGKLDFAVASTVLISNQPRGEIRVYLGDGAGGFTAFANTITLPAGDANGDVIQLIARDIDADGRPDLIAVQNSRFHIVKN